MKAPRLQSIDVVRGLVMVLMAIDHVRVYSGIPAGGPTAAVFFTRWITHFCAPAFVFLAGTSAFLYAAKLEDRFALSRFLLGRGFLLVLLELTIIRFAWTFNFDYGRFTLAGVIWMLGWCMVLLAPCVLLPARIVGVIGLAIIFLQQLFRYPPNILSANLQRSVGQFWEFIYPAGIENHSGINILYVLVPWIGVMAAGYAFGAILGRPQLCLAIGLSATALFLVIGVGQLLLIPAPPNAMPAILRLLNQQKYPASQLYLLMTLGPIIALLPAAERARGWLVTALATVGRVPMFYYLLHIPMIHLAALLVNFLRDGKIHQDWYATAPYVFLPPEHRWSLPLLYLVWAVIVVILYFASRWFAGVKRQRNERWLTYI